MPDYKRIPTDDIGDRSFDSLTALLWAMEENENTQDAIEKIRRQKLFLKIGIGMDLDIQKTIQALVNIIQQSRSMAETQKNEDIVKYIDRQLAAFGEG